MRWSQVVGQYRVKTEQLKIAYDSILCLSLFLFHSHSTFRTYLMACLMYNTSISYLE